MGTTKIQLTSCHAALLSLSASAGKLLMVPFLDD